MKFQRTEIEGVILVEPDVFRDPRGFFMETYHAKKYADGSILASFVQDNHSLSLQGTLRGLHAQREHPQGKLVRAIGGRIFDVAVDVRRGSPTFGKWVGHELSSENHRQLYTPPGLVHGFCVLSEKAQVEYKCTDFYYPNDELGIIWNDPEIAIEWPLDNPVLSEKDAVNPRLSDVMERLPEYG